MELLVLTYVIWAILDDLSALMKRCGAGWVSAESRKSDKFLLYCLFVSFCVLDDQFDLPGRVAAYPVQEVSSEINEQFSFLLLL